jgi:iron complex transport system ATP-binding protein
MAAAIAVEHVSFSYGDSPILRDVSLEIASRSLTGILGPNGSGKTTLLRLMSGALRQNAGTISLAGTPVAQLPRRTLAQRLAVVPQETELAFDYSVLEIALMGRYPHLGAFEIEGPEDMAIARRALASTGTLQFADRTFRTLSGGEKQRVSIASALAQVEGVRTPALFLDEPTASLDLRYQLEVGALLRRLREERELTIALTTHDLHFARAVCTQIVLLADGRVLAQGPPAEVLTPEIVGELYDVDAALVAPLLT